MPTTELAEDDFTEGSIDILTMLVKGAMVASKSEGRRAVQQGGVTVEGEKLDVSASFTKDDLSGDGVIVKKGKKNFMKFTVKN